MPAHVHSGRADGTRACKVVGSLAATGAFLDERGILAEVSGWVARSNLVGGDTPSVHAEFPFGVPSEFKPSSPPRWRVRYNPT